MLNYIKSNFNVEEIICKVLYTDIDDIYECLSIKEPRDFGQKTYDGYANSIVNTIHYINNLCKELLNEKLITEITYLYRDNYKYEEYQDESHLLEILSELKKIDY